MNLKLEIGLAKNMVLRVTSFEILLKAWTVSEFPRKELQREGS